MNIMYKYLSDNKIFILFLACSYRRNEELTSLQESMNSKGIKLRTTLQDIASRMAVIDVEIAREDELLRELSLNR